MGAVDQNQLNAYVNMTSEQLDAAGVSGVLRLAIDALHNKLTDEFFDAVRRRDQLAYAQSESIRHLRQLLAETRSACRPLLDVDVDEAARENARRVLDRRDFAGFILERMGGC